MLSNLEIKVNVTFGLADGLTALIRELLPEKAAQKPSARKKAAPAKAEAEAEAEVKTEAKAKAAAAEKTEAPKPQPAETAAANGSTDAAPTAEDVRAAMRAARQRIEGEDYSTNPESPGYKTFHRQLTQQFLTIAQRYGAAKPSLLDESKRAAFIGQCNDLFAGDDGTIKTNAPF